MLHGSNDLYGASRVLAQDVVCLRSLGHDVAVVLPGNGPLGPQLADTGCEVHVDTTLTVARRVRGFRNPCLPYNLPGPARPDQVVLWTLAMALYGPLLRLRKIPYVVSVHELLPSMPGRSLAKLAIGRRAPAQVNSQAVRTWLRASCGVSQVDLAYPPAPQREVVIPRRSGGPLRLLLAARLNGWKGHAEAVAVLRVLRQRGVRTELTLAGSPYPGQNRHLDVLREAIGGLEGVTYSGHVVDMKPLMRCNDLLLCLPSRPEPFGLTPLEAWAVGRRTVALAQGGLAESTRLVDGVLVDEFDVNRVADAVTWTMENQLLAPPRADAPAAIMATSKRRKASWQRLLTTEGDPR